MRALAKFRRDWRLHVMILLPLVWLIVFCYLPMTGIQIAFRKYAAATGIWDSPWVGLDNFKRFFGNPQVVRIIWNTFRISVYSLLAGFPMPILLALLINSIPSRRFSKVIQMITYAPYFISTVVMVGMLLQVLNANFGLYGQIMRLLGVARPVNLLVDVSNFDHIYVISGIWQGTGYGAVIYIATLAGIDPTMYEAAIIDGATKFQRIRYIDIPNIIPTAIILLILNMGSILNVGFEKIFLLQNNLNTSLAEVISTYVYKVGIGAGFPDYSFSTAIGLFNSVICAFLIITANTIARRMGETSLW